MLLIPAVSRSFCSREVDFLARGQANVGLLPVTAAAFDAAEAPILDLDVGHGHRVDLDLEHQLDRRLDLGLGGAIGDAEHVLPVLVGDVSAFLRHHRREHDGHELRGVVFLRGGHLKSSSSLATAALVTRIDGKRTSDTGLAWRTSMISTLARLRDESIRFSSIASVMTSTPSKPIDLTFCASSFVLGCSTVKASTTRMRSSRASCERIEAMPARYILRFTLCEKFSSGEFGKILPPPRHSGLEGWLGFGFRLLLAARPCGLGDLDRGPHDHIAAARARNRALDEQQLALGIDPHHFQVENRAARIAEMSGHALAGKYAPGRLV